MIFQCFQHLKFLLFNFAYLYNRTQETISVNIFHVVYHKIFIINQKMQNKNYDILAVLIIRLPIFA